MYTYLFLLHHINYDHLGIVYFLSYIPSQQLCQLTRRKIKLQSYKTLIYKELTHSYLTSSFLNVYFDFITKRSDFIRKAKD